MAKINLKELKYITKKAKTVEDYFSDNVPPLNDDKLRELLEKKQFHNPNMIMYKLGKLSGLDDRIDEIDGMSEGKIDTVFASSKIRWNESL